MKVVIQKVSQASVSIKDKTIAFISKGVLVLVGIVDDDTNEDINWLCKKIANLRIFTDDSGIMQKSLLDINAEVIVVSQFTLYASTKKGNRPSYAKAAKPDVAMPLYQKFVNTLSIYCNQPIATGKFGANMQVKLINDGPVTLIIDSKSKN